MLDQLTQLVQQFGDQAVVKNNAVPNELNDNANSNDDSIEIEPTSRDDKRLVDR